MYNRFMEEKKNMYFEYVAWLKKQPSVIDFAKHYITTYGVEKYFDINNRESVEFIASLFAQAYAYEDGYRFNKETEFDKGFTISDIIDKTCLLERTLFRIERALKYNEDGSVTVNLWKDLDEMKEFEEDLRKKELSLSQEFKQNFETIRETIDETL